MKLFNFFSKKEDKKESLSLLAPISGEVVAIENVEDQTFASKILGDGIAIQPTGGEYIIAPMDGVVDITPTLHAFTIENKDGVNILVHFGLETVNLKGKGFEKLVNSGAKVKAGDKIIKFDYNFLKENAPSTITPVIVLEPENYSEVKKISVSNVVAGEEEIIEIVK